jgi:hypothetical protein
MPTVLRIHGFRFFFFSGEGNEPPHIHVEYGDSVAKFWLNPVDLAMSAGFRSHELTRVRALVIEHRLMFLEKWNEYFGDQA